MKVGTATDDIERCEETDRTDEEFLKRFRYLSGPSSPAIHCYLEDIQREILFCISTCRGVSSSSKGSESRDQSAHSNAKQTMRKKRFATDLQLGSLLGLGKDALVSLVEENDCFSSLVVLARDTLSQVETVFFV